MDTKKSALYRVRLNLHHSFLYIIYYSRLNFLKSIKKFVPYISLNFNFNFEIFFKRLKRLINSKNKSNIEGVTLILYIKNATIIKSANIKNKSSRYRCILSKISLINVVPPTWTHNLNYTFFFVFFIIDFQLITRLRCKTAV